MTHRVLARKWRPQNFTQVVGQEPIVRALTNALERQQLHHAYLFTGTRGVGKTSLARILAKCLNCETGPTSTPCEQCPACSAIGKNQYVDLLEVDAASRTRVEDTRELLENVAYQPTMGRYKIYLVDEVHMLSTHSFNALLKTLEEPPAHVVFLLATTDPQKLPQTVLSRCLQFHLRQLSEDVIKGQLAHILQAESIDFEDSALHLLAQAACGSMRDALSLCDQAIAFCQGKLSASALREMLGYVSDTQLLTLLEAIITDNRLAAMAAIDEIAQYHNDFDRCLADLATLLHAITLIQQVPDYRISHPLADDLLALSKQADANDIQLFYQTALHGRRDLPLAPTSRQGLEMTVLRMLAFRLHTTQILTTSKIVKSVAMQSETPPSFDNWAAVIPQLKLSGPTLAFAKYCTLKQISDNQITLIVAPAQQAMLNKAMQQRLQQALQVYSQREIILSIEVTSQIEDSPAKMAAHQEAVQQNSARQQINTDQTVQNIIERFDGTLKHDSIESITPSKQET